MYVKFSNLYKANSDHKKINFKITELIKKNQFIGGEEVDKFEYEFAKFVGSKYCVSLANGTDALEIAIESLNLKKGSEIIVPVNTWISTAECVNRTGHKLVFCDIDLHDYCINLDDLVNKISKKTKVIIPVHLYGYSSKITEIKKISKKYKLKVIEDCAQAHGTLHNGQHVGTFGDIGAFSFYPSKNLGAYGDGGAIVTNNKTIAEKCKRIRNHGALKKYDYKFVGRNSRLDTINAAILRIKLKKLNEKIKKRNLLAKVYFKNLNHFKKINLPYINNSIKHSFHQFVIRLDKRDKLKNYLKKNKIDTMIHYPYMLCDLNFYKNTKGVNSLLNSKGLAKKLLSLPISEDHTIKEIEYVSKKIIQFKYL